MLFVLDVITAGICGRMFVFGRSRISVSTRRRAILTRALRCFPQSFQTNFGTLLLK